MVYLCLCFWHNIQYNNILILYIYVCGYILYYIIIYFIRAIYTENNGTNIKQISYDHTPMGDYNRLYDLIKNDKNLYNRVNQWFIIDENEYKLDGNGSNNKSISLFKRPYYVVYEDSIKKKSRLLATIGVARAFGNYNLTAFGFKNIKIKDFLSNKPYINIVTLNKKCIRKCDLMVIACDGVFDVLNNSDVIRILKKQIFYNNDSLIDDVKNIDVKKLDNACGYLGLHAYKVCVYLY